jgi:hypothetical protein
MEEDSTEVSMAHLAADPEIRNPNPEVRRSASRNLAAQRPQPTAEGSDRD